MADRLQALPSSSALLMLLDLAPPRPQLTGELNPMATACTQSIREPATTSHEESQDSGNRSEARSIFSDETGDFSSRPKRRVASWDSTDTAERVVTLRPGYLTPRPVHALQGDFYRNSLGNEATVNPTSSRDHMPPFPLQSLPDELLAHCLARASGSWAGPGCILLRGVCQRWRKLVKTTAFLDLRESVGRSQQWLATLTSRTAGGLLCKLFDPLTNKCQRLACSLASLPPERRHFGAATVGREIIVLGGEVALADGTGLEASTHYIDSVEAYNSVLDISRVLPPIPGSGRSRFACCSGEGRLFVMGGVGSNGMPLTSCLALDVRAEEWTELPPMSKARVGAKAQWCRGQVVVMGGREDSSEISEPLMSIEALDLEASRWIPLPELPVPRTDMQVVVVHDRLCAVGGERPLEGNEDDNFAFDDDKSVACFNAPLVLDRSSGSWKMWKGGRNMELRSVEGVEGRLDCKHPPCASYQSRSYAVVVVYDELYLVRRCDKGRSSYCRHIHRFLPAGMLGVGTAWECIQRGRAYSSLLREAGDCWEHSIVDVVWC